MTAITEIVTRADFERRLLVFVHPERQKISGYGYIYTEERSESNQARLSIIHFFSVSLDAINFVTIFPSLELALKNV